MRSYARLSRDVGGRIDFACDLNNVDALDAAEQEKQHLDHAFFVLSFAALENQVTILACAKLDSHTREMAMRGASFERRWDAAVKIGEEISGPPLSWASARPVVLSWYKIRSDIAHGQSPATFTDVPAVIDQANQIAATVVQVTDALAASRS